jgi:DHA1 family bicyclomycin/chloramphenicol resistance-like MFS transporter
MAIEFNAPYESIAASFTLNWVAKGFGTMFWGPISDRVGRKPCLTSCCIIILLANLCCAGAPNVYWFWIGRALQGFSEGGETVTRCVARDCYDNFDMRMNIYLPALGVGLLGLMLAPLIGGILAQLTGSWRWIFVILAGCGLLLRICTGFFLEETLTPSGIDQTFFQDARQVLGNKHQMTLLFTLLIYFSLLFSEQSTDTFIVQDTYGMSTLFFASLSIVWAVIFLIGLVISAVSNELLGPIRKVQWGTALTPLPAVFMIVIACSPLVDSIWWYLFGRGTGMLLQGVNEGVVENLFIQNVNEYAGTAMAILNVAQYTIGGTASAGLAALIVNFGAAGSLMVIRGLSILYWAVFWLGFGLRPPEWIKDLDKPRTPRGTISERASERLG